MKTVRTDIPYWGRRTYLHSSQMLTALESALPALSIDRCDKIVVKLRSFLRTQGEFFIKDGTTADRPHYGTFSVQFGSEKILIALGDTGDPVESFLPDDEKAIIEACSVDLKAKTASISSYPGERFFSVVVALNKKLICDLLPIEDGQAWILAKMEMETPFLFSKSHPEIKCRIVSVIANRMVNTSLIFNGETLGSTVFTKVDKP